MKKHIHGLKLMVLITLFLSIFSFSALAQEAKSCKSMKIFNQGKSILKQAGLQDLSFCSMERKHLFDDVFEYSLVFKVGKGCYDKIGIHRVVKEKKPYMPIKTKI